MVHLGVILYLICLVGTPISILILIIRALMKKRIRKNAVATGLFMAGFVVGVVMILRSPDIEEKKIGLAADTRVVGGYVDRDDEFYDEAEKDNSVDIHDDVNTGGDIEKIIFDVSEYPYQNEKEAKKLMKIYKKAMEAPITDFIGVEEVSEGGIIREEEIHYKKTVDVGTAAYRYYGKVNKEGEPEGTGILFTAWPTEWQESGNVYTTICYIGGFKEGFKEGYGIEYWELSQHYMVDYEGEFKKGKYHGEGIDYLYYVSDSYASTAEMRDEVYSQIEGNTLIVEPICLSLKCYEGDFKEGEYDGKGKEYSSVVDNKEILTYEGEFKEGRFNGEGTLYFDNGNIKYKGEFKNSYYSGKGTLYDEQGNVVHKGKFKNGDIE